MTSGSIFCNEANKRQLYRFPFYKSGLLVKQIKSSLKAAIPRSGLSKLLHCKEYALLTSWYSYDACFDILEQSVFVDLLINLCCCTQVFSLANIGMEGKVVDIPELIGKSTSGTSNIRDWYKYLPCVVYRGHMSIIGSRVHRWPAEHKTYVTSLLARFMGPTWGPSGDDRTQVDPMLAPWTLLSGMT